MIATSPHLTLLHVSDVHATESGVLYGEIAPLARLTQVAEYALDHGLAPDAVVITGDLVQRGNAGAYPLVEAACRGLESRLGVPVITVLGNHDDPAEATQLTGHELGHTGVETVRGTRIVRLNSHTRELGDEQLAWLAEVLEEPAAHGTVLALHHAPTASPMPVLRKQGLADADKLMRVLEGRDVRAMLAGHFHHAQSAVVGSTPVFVAPALAYHQVMHAGPTRVAGHSAPWFQLVHLSPRGVQSTPIELAPGTPVFSEAARG